MDTFMACSLRLPCVELLAAGDRVGGVLCPCTVSTRSAVILSIKKRVVLVELSAQVKAISCGSLAHCRPQAQLGTYSCFIPPVRGLFRLVHMSATHTSLTSTRHSRATHLQRLPSFTFPNLAEFNEHILPCLDTPHAILLIAPLLLDLALQAIWGNQPLPPASNTLMQSMFTRRANQIRMYCVGLVAWLYQMPNTQGVSSMPVGVHSPCTGRCRHYQPRGCLSSSPSQRTWKGQDLLSPA